MKVTLNKYFLVESFEYSTESNNYISLIGAGCKPSSLYLPPLMDSNRLNFLLVDGFCSSSDIEEFIKDKINDLKFLPQDKAEDFYKKELDYWQKNWKLEKSGKWCTLMLCRFYFHRNVKWDPAHPFYEMNQTTGWISKCQSIILPGMDF